MEQATSNPALQRLDVLVGEWEMEIPQWGAHARVTFDRLEGGAFLVHHWGDATMIIGPDDSTGAYCVLYHDARGVSRVYQMSLDTDVWKLWRDSPGFCQRFTGTLSDDGTTITARWEKAADGSTWEHDFDITYTRVC